MSRQPKKKRYDWPPPVAPEDAYVPRNRNPIHSILTALPVIMLVTGLYFYYQGESVQSDSMPIREESMEVSGTFTGLSVISSGSQGRHYLWFEQDGKARGVRVQPGQAETLQSLRRGGSITLGIAPSVPGSSTYWVWYVQQDGKVYLDTSDELR
ncbi:MAG: hypothetical protein HKN42_00805 [Granulosicoccus sp.]|nr:hypothetical protein [Granulosicoccus sp.]